MVVVNNIDSAVKFYRDQLGLKLQFEQEDWAQFTEGIGLMVSPEPLPIVNTDINRVIVTFDVEDASDEFRKLTSRGVAFLVPPTDIGGAIVASFRDSEGNLLQLLQRLA